MEMRARPSESFSKLLILIKVNDHFIIELILGFYLPILEAHALYVVPSFTIIYSFISKNIAKSEGSKKLT